MAPPRGRRAGRGGDRGARLSQYHFDAETYLSSIVGEIPHFGAFQDAVAQATAGVRARRMLELGTGTGETARRVAVLHPGARLTGIDASADMLARARELLPDADLGVARLEDALPEGPFELVFSALAVHHLDAGGKRDLFRRVRERLAPDGRFVLGDVVVPERPEDARTPLTPAFDLPDSAEDQLAWLREAGFAARLAWSRGDLAVICAE